MDFSRFDTFIFDLDGTIWNWIELFPKVRIKINLLLQFGKQRRWVSNNTVLSRSGLVKKMKNFGIEVEESEVINAGYAIGQYLKDKKGKSLVFGEGLKEDLRKAKVRLTNNPSADFVVVGHDWKFNYEKLVLSSECLQKGARLLTSARGRYFTFGDKMIPGTGALTDVVEYVSGKKALLLGKPSDYMLKTLKSFINSPVEKTVEFGDELKADIVMGKKAGWFTVLVRTGVDKKPSKTIKPDAVIDSVADIKI
jgi:HAD superfamily hydrolase (TIGR01450 family)